MADPQFTPIDEQHKKYLKDMEGLQAALERQPGPLGSMFAAIGQFFTGFLPHIGEAIVGVIPKIGQAIVLQWKAFNGQIAKENTAWLLKRMASGDTSKELGTYLTNLLETSKDAGTFVVAIYTIFAMIGEVSGFLRVVTSDYEQTVNRRIMNVLPDASAATRAMFIDPTLEAKVREIYKRYGLTPERTDMMIAAARAQLDPGTIQTLYLRGEITGEEATERLHRLGYADATQELLKKTWSVIPGPQDIIRFAVREAFDEMQVAELGLDDAFPPAVEEWAAKVGLSSPWPKMYWRAHWELPSPQMGFEMLHRGEITEEQLSSLLKALDYSPRWHGPLKNIAYNVVTRVDARRLYELGIWNEEKLTDAYRKMGYAPQDAEDLTAWTKVEYAQTDKELTRAQIEKGYNARMITGEEAKRMLVSLGYGEERAEWLLDMADFSAEVKLRDELIGTMKINYMAGISSMTQVRQRLGEEEVDPGYIEKLLERWEAEKISQRRLPSKSDLDKFLKAGLMVEADYKSELARLGYSGEMADLYFRLNSGGGATNG